MLCNPKCVFKQRCYAIQNVSLSSVVPAMFFCYRLLLRFFFCFFFFCGHSSLCFYFNLISQLKPNFMRSLQGLMEESLSKCSRSYVVLYYCHRHHFFLRWASLKQCSPRNAGSLFKDPTIPHVELRLCFCRYFL